MGAATCASTKRAAVSSLRDHKAMRSMMARLAVCVRERQRQISVYVNESRKPGREAGNGRWCLMMHGIKGMRWKRPNVVSVAWSCWR